MTGLATMTSITALDADAVFGRMAPQVRSVLDCPSARVSAQLCSHAFKVVKGAEPGARAL
jgi:hypothetical protein